MLQKEVQKVTLAQREIVLAPWNVGDPLSMLFRLWPGTIGPLPRLLRTMMFLEVEIQWNILIPPDQLV